MLTPADNLLRWLIPRLSLPLLVLNGWVLLLLIYYFKVPLSILVVGTVIACLLGHPVRWLKQRGMKRMPAILTILIMTLLLLGLLGVTFIPLLSQQAQALVKEVPAWEQSADRQIQALHD